MIKYSDNPLDNLKKATPSYYQLYNVSVFITYFGLLAISWYFINLAYTINTQYYDILTDKYGAIIYYGKITFLLSWLFFLYFYVLNEVRFRFIHFSSKKEEQKVKNHNYYYVISSFVLTFLSMLILLK